VHISDIHSDSTRRLEGRIPGIIAAQKPDLIVFTGDAVNSPGGLPHFRRCITEIAAVAPTFAVQGNWDVWFSGDLDLYGGTGVHVMNGRAVVTDVRGTRVWIAGVPYGSITRVLDTVPTDAFSIYLYHTPDEIFEVAKQPVDLYCAGHIHGGQVALPFYGAMVTLSRLDKQFEAGLYRVRDTWLYVSRGIGMEGGSIPRVRFWSRPEITVIEVGPSES
jgi:predicted MPP superfamily phosphohydrolase